MIMDDVILSLNKAFSLIFIFTIPSINLWLIGNFLYWKNIFSKDKKCIITSLAISDVLIGLFCLPVEANLYFDIYLGGPGCVLSYAQIYARYFSPFVYGIGISVLSVELILKGINRSFYGWSKLLTILASFFPWLAAVLIVLPLTFIGKATNSCWYLPRNAQGIGIWAVSTFLPIFLCMVMWVVSAFVKWNTAAAYNSSSHHMSSTVSRESSRHMLETGPTSQPLMSSRVEVATVGPEQFATAASPDTETETSLERVGNSPSPTPIDFSQIPARAINNQSPPGGQQLVISTTYSLPPSPENVGPDDQVVTIHGKEDKRGRETLHLLIVLLIYVVLTVPFSLYNLMSLASFLYGNDSFVSDGTFLTLKWMQISRSLFIPVAWSLFFYIERGKAMMTV